MLFLGTLLLFKIHHLENSNFPNSQATNHTVITENSDIQDFIVNSTECQPGKSFNGGAYLIEAPAASVNFTNCQFLSCFNIHYFISIVTTYYGGALYFSNIENTYIKNTIFSGCTSPSAGAVGLSNVTLAVFENTSFIHNEATCFLFVTQYGDGGAIWFDKTNGCSLILNDCFFDSNTAGSGAGVFLDPNADELIVDNCTFMNNHNEHYGGAAILAADSTYIIPIKKVTVISSKFINNSIYQGSDSHEGSAFFIDSADFLLKDCYFTQNTGPAKANCPVLKLRVNNNAIILDSCTCYNNTGSFAKFSGEYLDAITIFNCNISNNQFFDDGIIYGDPLPKQLTFENSIFTSNTGTKCHTIHIPPGNLRKSNITNCIFDSIGITASGPTVLIESFTKVTNSSFINHDKDTLTIQLSKAHLLIKSIIFHNNSCTDDRTGQDGILCEGSNISFIDTDVSTQIIIKSADVVIFENSIINRLGIDIAASYIYLTNTKILSLSKSEILNLTASYSFVAKNITCNNNNQINYINFRGQTNESTIEILSSSFSSSPIQISNAGSVYVNNSQFTQCFGNIEGGAVHIGNQVDSAYIHKCSFSNCRSSSGNGGAIYANTNTNFILNLTSFDQCKSNDFGSCLYLNGGQNSIIDNCTFHNNVEGNSASVYIQDKSNTSQTIFVNGCFSSDAQKISNADVNVHHIYSNSAGSVSFEYPMCFDRSKEESVYFNNGQDADKGYDCYNCLDCGKMPFPGPTTVPTSPSVPPTIVPTESATPSDGGGGDDSDSGNKKLSKTLIVGIVVACVALVIIIIVIIIVVIKRKRNNNQEIDPSSLIAPNSPIQLNTQENLPDTKE